MPKIAFVGAGSAVFTRNLVGDILSLPELRDSAQFALMDIDPDRLRTAELLTERLIEAHGARASVTATTDRRGGFTLTAPGGGQYRVVATLGGTSATSKRLTVR